MEILGSNVARSLQNAIASGLESVTAGVTESTKIAGGSALGIAQDSFSFEQIGSTSASNLTTAAEPATYPGPSQYFQDSAGLKTGSPVSAFDIGRKFQEVQFNAPKTLQTFSWNMWDAIGEAQKKLEEQIKAYQEAVKSKTIYPDADPNKDLGAVPTDKLATMSPGELLNRPTEPTMPKGWNDVGYRLNRTDVVGPSPDNTPAAERVNARNNSIDKYFGSASQTVEGLPTSGPTDPDTNESGGAGSTGTGSDRSIIVVGGKTSDTYLQGLGDSWVQLQQNPNEQNAQLVSNQFNAVVGMASTVDEAVKLQKDLASFVLLGNLRG